MSATGSEGRGAWTLDAGRGVALVVGVYSLLNALGALVAPVFDTNRWWIDLRPSPRPVAIALLLVAGALLAAHGLRAATGARRAGTFVVVLFLLAVTASNGVTALVMRFAGRVGGAASVPYSVFLTAVLASALVSLSEDAAPAKGERARVALVALALVGAVPLAQILSFGRSDQRRPADLIVVFGARVYADGRPSPALRDRVVTAAALYRAGLAPRVLMSGARGDGEVHETAAMRNLAARLGVPLRAIIRDTQGLDTRSTVRTALGLCRARGWCRVLAVSHGYHLARVGMTFERAGLATVYTVPSENSLRFATARFTLREIAALWFHHVAALWGGRARQSSSSAMSGVPARALTRSRSSLPTRKNGSFFASTGTGS